jgi:folate-dependent phosphoribosylglycinamide formyltransferase PurN
MSTSLFSPQKPLRVFVLFSGNATAIQYLRRMDPEYNSLYSIIGALTTNKTAPGSTFFVKHTNNADKQTHIKGGSQRKAAIPCKILDWRTFESACLENKREEYFQKLLEILAGYDFDIIVCSGFHLRIPDFFIKIISPRKIINTHPTNLTVYDIATRKRLFVGLWKEAIQIALNTGMQDSCSTAHYITAGDDIDGGEIIAQSQRFKLISGETPGQVQWRLTQIGSDGQALALALKIICNQRPLKETLVIRLKKLFQSLRS